MIILYAAIYNPAKANSVNIEADSTDYSWCQAGAITSQSFIDQEDRSYSIKAQRSIDFPTEFPEFIRISSAYYR